MIYGDENTVWISREESPPGCIQLVDGNDLYGVPENERLDHDAPEPNEPLDLSTVPVGEVLFLGED